jgi:ferredoxin
MSLFPRRTPHRLVVDAAACDGHGICVLRCPDRLALDSFGYVGIEDDAPLLGKDLRRARSAAAACPEGALSVLPIEQRPHVEARRAAGEQAHSLAWSDRDRRDRA